MEQLRVIRITDNGEVNEVCLVTFNEDHGKVLHKQIVRRHLTKIIGFLFGMRVKVYYEFKEVINEQSNTSEPTAVSPAKEDGSISDAQEDHHKNNQG